MAKNKAYFAYGFCRQKANRNNSKMQKARGGRGRRLFQFPISGDHHPTLNLNNKRGTTLLLTQGWTQDTLGAGITPRPKDTAALRPSRPK